MVGLHVRNWEKPRVKGPEVVCDCCGCGTFRAQMRISMQ